MELKFILESLLFTSQEPLNAREFRDHLKYAAEFSEEAKPFRKATEEEIGQALEQLAADHAQAGRSYRLACVAGSWQFCTQPEFFPWVRSLVGEKNRPPRLSHPAMETLAIVAYRQPITRTEIEQVRGVSVDGVIQTLLERGLVVAVGRAEVVGRPVTFGTTEAFLEYFGLRSLEDLPAADELRRIPVQKPETLLTADPGLATVPPEQLQLGQPAAETPAGSPPTEAVPAEATVPSPATEPEALPSPEPPNEPAPVQEPPPSPAPPSESAPEPEPKPPVAPAESEALPPVEASPKPPKGRGGRKRAAVVRAPSAEDSTASAAESLPPEPTRAAQTEEPPPEPTVQPPGSEEVEPSASVSPVAEPLPPEPAAPETAEAPAPNKPLKTKRSKRHRPALAAPPEEPPPEPPLEPPSSQEGELSQPTSPEAKALSPEPEAAKTPVARLPSTRKGAKHRRHAAPERPAEPPPEPPTASDNAASTATAP